MTDHDLRRALADLCEVRSDAEPIVTLYLDTSWTDEKQRERARVYVQDSVKLAVDRHAAHPQLAALRRTLGRVAQTAAERAAQPDGASRGLAVFACEALALWRVVDVPRPFRNELCVDGRPHLLQLARLVEDVEPAIVAFAHTRGLHVYEVALGTIVNEATVEGAFTIRGRHASGSYHGQDAAPHGAPTPASGLFERAAKNERHIEAMIDRARREGAELLRSMAERDPRAHVVLVGTGEVVAAFERHLPERVRERVLARLPRPPGKESWRVNGQHRIVDEVVAKLAEHERKVEAETVEHAIGEALRGGHAVLGPEDVVLAVNEQRVQRLIVEEDFERSGWRCRNCGALGMTHEELCSFCRGPLARVDALGEELVGRVLASDGEVEVVAHTNRLHSYRGVAALLRQAKAKGLSGREREAPRQ